MLQREFGDRGLQTGWGKKSRRWSNTLLNTTTHKTIKQRKQCHTPEGVNVIVQRQALHVPFIPFYLVLGRDDRFQKPKTHCTEESCL